MNLKEKVGAVEAVFNELDREISQFQSWSTLHCKWGCGKCCSHPDVEATPLEFLPFAFHLYKQGLAEEWLAKVKLERDSICLILNPTQGGAGLCSEYTHRGLICRLFGYSARTNKYGKKEMVTCQIIKTEQVEAYATAEQQIGEGRAIPVMNEYYMKLQSIDPDLTAVFYPINEAIQHAIETVLHYFAYRTEEES